MMIEYSAHLCGKSADGFIYLDETKVREKMLYVFETMPNTKLVIRDGRAVFVFDTLENATLYRIRFA